MSGPYRITRHISGGKALGAEQGDAADNFDMYLDRLMRLIPAEVVALYVVGGGFIPAGDPNVLAVWALICLIGVFAIRIYGTSTGDKKRDPQWGPILISASAFIIWVYTLGGPFEDFGVHVPYVGSLAVLVFTFFVPIFYKGPAIA